MVGQTLAHYKILEKIGSGGMGDVYLAEDTKLDRKVALKVLPPELAESEERRARFKRLTLARRRTYNMENPWSPAPKPCLNLAD